ncbi:hyaluronate lyase, partial [Micromonospora aurantiaca]
DVFHAMLASPPGWRMFVRFCQGRASFADVLDRRPVRAALAMLDRLPAKVRSVAG